jgi:hypothetical protein
MPDTRHTVPGKPEKIPHVEVYWHAVSYRTVAILIALILMLGFGIFYAMHPEWYGKALEKMSQSLGAEPTGAVLANNQARFVNLDGKVEVKKVSSVNWETADYRTTLDKGDLVRTAADGAARITFVDGTTYTVKSDSFVTVEENSVDRDSSTTVGMHISSGAVDLATGTWESPRSTAEVSFANARASLQENSRAAVSSDPVSKQNQMTVSAGAAEVQVGQQHIEIGKWERVTVAAGGEVTKSNVLAPPELVEPLNLQPLIVADPKHAQVHFSWSAVPDAVSYDMRISTNSMFTRVVAQKVLSGTSVDITGLDSGDYFWTVTATDKSKRESAPSEAFRFNVVAQGKAQEMLLEVDSTELHGNVVELSGRTEPGAALIINGETVADIEPDGKFHYFTQPLARGDHDITITGQNRRGGTAIKRVSILIP